MSAVVHGATPRTGNAFQERDVRVPFPGIPTTSDGAGMVVWVETHITQGACAYPITSSTTMGGGYQVEVANGTRNLWGEELAFIEPESEHSAASTCEGFAVAGGRVTNFTSGQGLILMKEVLYTISGKRLPIVFHIGARALTSQGLNVHTGHDDVVGVADCGWGVLYARNAQEAGDMALIARRVAEDTETPFLNVQDGFLTTHTIENVRLLEPDMMKMFVGSPSRLRNLMDPQVPLMSGVVQNQDSYMKAISVIERLDIPMMQSNPQLCEIKAAFADAMAETPGYPPITHMPRFFGGSAGLGSRDVRAGDFIAIVENMRQSKPRAYFTVGIKHPTALPIPIDPDRSEEHTSELQ